MALDDEKAQRWEAGCSTDAVRNNFLIPNLIRILENDKPRRILDIGTGTGYVPRHTGAGLSFRPAWTLIDIDPARLSVAEKELRDDAQVTLLQSDVTTHSFNEPFCAVLATFTLLEIEDLDGLIDRLPSLINEGGLLIVSLPDTWRDVIDHGASRPEKIEEFLRGRTSIPKIDKFTNDAYPFRAVRIEHLISRVLTSGFDLVELTESIDEGTQIFLMAFRRKGAKS